MASQKRSITITNYIVKLRLDTNIDKKIDRTILKCLHVR